MEAAARHVRTSQQQVPHKAQFLLVQDTLQVRGGTVVYSKLLENLCQHVLQSRDSSQRVVALALEKHLQNYAHLLKAASRVLDVVDCFSDPFGWLKICVGAAKPVAWRSGKGLAILKQHLYSHLSFNLQSAAEEAAANYVCIDSLDHLLQHASLAEVIQFLQDLQSHSAILGICAKLHEDLHSPQVIAAVTSLCTASLQLHPLQGLRKEMAMHAAPAKHAPHGQLQLHLKRHTGRVKVHADLYVVVQDGDLQTWAPPSEAVTVQLLAAQAVKSGKDSSGQKAPQVEAITVDPAAHEALLTSQAGMKLTLSSQEREARQAVILPYEHQGAGRAYQTDDYKDYLPHSAGGQGKGTGQDSLGHIMYVRDSESDHDSDEDPDDDLDI